MAVEAVAVSPDAYALSLCWATMDHVGFPRQIKISANGAGWHESDINRWIAYPAGWKPRGEFDFYDF